MVVRPAYKLTIGQESVDVTHEPRASTVVDLKVNLDMETPADSFLVVLGQVNGIQPARADQAKVELGYVDDGGLMQVMAGKVVAVEPNLTTKRVVGHTGAEALLRSFVDQTYESKTAGAIVRDLAGKATVQVGSVEDGIKFPAYVVDGQCSFYHHIRNLADLCGFDLYFNSDGQLVFEKFTGGKNVHVFEYAKQILALDVLRTHPFAGSVEAWGESPTGSKGDDAWPWLTKDFGGSKGKAGSGKPLLLLERPALRTADAARAAAEAAETRVKRRTLQGRLLTLGRPEVKLGDAIQLRSLLDQSLNQNLQVRRVTHSITKRDGFTTTVGFRSI